MASTTTDRATGTGDRMKAVTAERYGSPDVLKVGTIDRPTPTADEVLIRVHASTVGPVESVARRGRPLPIRAFSGLRKPSSTPGDAFAGVVDAVGRDVSRFAVGDEVFGTTAPESGAHAEYVCLAEDAALVTKPSNVSFADAAAVGDGGLTAMAFLRDVVDLRAGQSILVNGASGGIGTYAVQLAHHYGATVTGVCSTANVELVDSLGADTVVDYTATDFTTTGDRYDIVFDVAATRSYGDCKASLKPGGVYVTTAPWGSILPQMARTRLAGGRRALFAATGMHSAADKRVNLGMLRELLQAGELRTVLDRTYALDDIADAHRYVDTGHKRGAVIVSMN